MKRIVKSVMTACVAGVLSLAVVAYAEAPAAAPKGEGVVASEEVKNLPQVQVGDVVTIAYAEAFVYDVKKGGAAVDGGTVVGGIAAEAGQKPAGAIARETKVTVLITAIDPEVPSVTFKGPAGNTRTIKVRHPEKLQGVSVGDTVDITYTEALAIKVEEAPKK